MLNVTELTEQRYPSILEFHPGISCRLNCAFCYRDGETYDSGHDMISEECLKNLIYEFAGLGGRELYVSGGLEPFSRPEIAALAILWASEAGLKVKVYTNGVAKALSEQYIRKLLALRTKQVRFSVHAINPHTYHQVTHTDPEKTALYDVFIKVKGVMDARAKGGGTKVGIGFIALRENIGELTKAVRFWQVMGVDFFDLRFDVATELSVKPEILKEVENFQKLGDSGYFCPVRVNIGAYAHGKPCFASKCFAPFEKLVVDPFGMVWSCCLQAQPSYRPSWAKLGDLKSQSLRRIVEQVKQRFPRQHCRNCTPWEAEYNLRQEKIEKERAKKAIVCASSADRRIFQRMLTK